MDHVTHLGLDVHKDTIAVAILRPDQNVPTRGSSRTRLRPSASSSAVGEEAWSPATRRAQRATRRTGC
jgi:hypothetical protein